MLFSTKNVKNVTFNALLCFLLIVHSCIININQTKTGGNLYSAASLTVYASTFINLLGYSIIYAYKEHCTIICAYLIYKWSV